jgi:hypothetical protein
MDDEVFCLFVVLACMLTFAIPTPAQPVFAGFMAALVLAARFSQVPAAHRGRSGRDRHDVGGL